MRSQVKLLPLDEVALLLRIGTCMQGNYIRIPLQEKISRVIMSEQGTCQEILLN